MTWTKDKPKRGGYYYVGKYLLNTLNESLEGTFQYTVVKVTIDGAGGRLVAGLISVPENDESVLWCPIDPPPAPAKYK